MARCPHCGRPARRVWQLSGRKLHEHESGELCSDRKRRPRALTAERLATIRMLAAKPLGADKGVQQVQDGALELLKHLRALREFRLDVGWYTVVWIGRWLDLDKRLRESVATQRALQHDFARVQRAGRELNALFSDWTEHRAAQMVAEAASLIAIARPRASFPPLPATPSSGDGLMLDDLQRLAPEMEALRCKPCPHCGRAVKDLTFRLSGGDYHYVFVHPDRRLCGGDEPRIFLQPDEVVSLEKQARALRDAQEAAHYARSRLGELVDEVADLERAVDQDLRESAGWRDQMLAAMARYAQWGSPFTRGEYDKVVEVFKRLGRTTRLLSRVRGAARPRGATRKRIDEIEGSLVDLVIVFHGWRGAMRVWRRRGTQRRSLRLIAG